MTEQPSAEAASIVRLFTSFYDALCTHRDSDAAAALWSTDADIAMYGSEGEEARGPDDVQALLNSVRASTASIAFNWDDHTVHVEADVAWLTAFGTVTVDGRRTHYRTTAVFVHRGGNWQWHLHSGMELARRPAAPTAALPSQTWTHR